MIAAYIAVSIVMALLSGGLEAVLLTGPLMDLPDAAKRLLDVIKLIGVAAAYASLNAIAFALLGADMDRPLWRYHGWQDALRRFFTPWMLLSLSYILLFRMTLWFGIDHPVSQLLLLLCCLVYTVHLPIGVAIMHQGRLEWRHLGDAVMPLIIQLPRMIIPLLMGLYLFFLTIFSGDRIRPTEDGALQWIWGGALFQIVAGLFACVIVTTTWCTLMLHRDEQDEDFDL